MDESLATTTEEGRPERCQVCGFPAIAGQVQGDVEGEKCSLKLCPSCFKYVFLCLRDSYRQNRLFDDDFEIDELCRFCKAQSAPEGKAKEWEQMKPVGREFGADGDDEK